MKIINMLDLADMKYQETPIEELECNRGKEIPSGCKGEVYQKYTADLGNGYSIKISRIKFPEGRFTKWSTEIYFPEKYKPFGWARDNGYPLDGRFYELSDQIRYTVDKMNREAGYGKSGNLELQGVLRGFLEHD